MAEDCLHRDVFDLFCAGKGNKNAIYCLSSTLKMSPIFKSSRVNVSQVMWTLVCLLEIKKYLLALLYIPVLKNPRLNHQTFVFEVCAKELNSIIELHFQACHKTQNA